MSPKPETGNPKPKTQIRMVARSLRVTIITPAPRHSRKGNRVSAERWARLLRSLGHSVRVVDHFDDRCFDVAFVLHARRCAPDLRAARQRCKAAPLVLCLTGTDVYDDIHHDAAARESLHIADRLIVLQPLATRQLPAKLRDRARVIYQSVEPPGRLPRRGNDVCVVGHVRDVKDPLRAALAARLLPEGSRMRVKLAGGIIERAWRRRIRQEARENPRFEYVGELPRSQAIRLIASSRALVVSSRLEGGANVISEACVTGTPVIASRMDGNVGLLGEDYPGYFEVGDEHGLAKLLHRLEADAAFEAMLVRRCKALARRFTPEREQAALKKLLAELR